MSKQPRTSRTSAWQPIGLATPQQPDAVVRTLAAARVSRSARRLVAPGVALAATLGVVSTAAAQVGVVPTPGADVTVTSTPGSDHAEAGSEAAPTTSTTTSTKTSTSSKKASAKTDASVSALSGLPIVGGFLGTDVLGGGILTGGLFGGDTVQTSASNGSTSSGGHGGGHTEGGDACDFFLDHMWKNEDGIPVIGTNTHFLTFHTDPDYKNLILSLASGAIGNSEMPIIDVYGGPLGWIPIFNPSHVRGHGTDYVTLLTGCGGMGIPIDPKTLSLDLEKLPTPEKVTALLRDGMPNLPSLPKLMDPDYLYNTLAITEIMNRLGPATVFTTDEYLAFAGNNFDAFRLLWQTALEKVGSGDPTAILEVLQITENIKTLESLGLPGLPGSTSPNGDLTGDIPIAGDLLAGVMTGDVEAALPTGDLTSGIPVLGGILGGGSDPSDPSDPSDADGATGTIVVGGKTYPVRNGSVTIGGKAYPVRVSSVTVDGKTHPVRNGSVTVNGNSYPVHNGSVTIGGKSYPVRQATVTINGKTYTVTPSSSDDEPSGTPSSGLPILGDILGGGSSPVAGLPVVGDLLGGGSTPSDPGDDDKPGEKPGDKPGDKPGAGLPIVGDILGGGSSPVAGLPVVGDLLGGGSTPSDPGDDDKPGEKPGEKPGDKPGDKPGAGLPIVGDILGGGSSPVAGLPVVGDLLGGGSAPSDPGNDDGDNDTDNPGNDDGDNDTDNPGNDDGDNDTDNPGNDDGDNDTDNPGNDDGDNEPTGTVTIGGKTYQVRGDTVTINGVQYPVRNSSVTVNGVTYPVTPRTPGTPPIDSPQGTVAFNLGSPKVNGTTSPNAPGAIVPVGGQVTYTVPVTNTGDLPITTLVGKASDGGTLTGGRLPLKPGQTTTLTYTTTAKPGAQAVTFSVVGSNPNGQQQGKSCSAVYTGEVEHGQIASTDGLMVDGKVTNDDVRYTFHSTDPAKVSFQVTNSGDAPLRSVSATSPSGTVTGGKATLQPGESTWFTVVVQPRSGLNNVPISFSGTDPSGKTTVAKESFDYTLCTCASPTTPQA